MSAKPFAVMSPARGAALLLLAVSLASASGCGVSSAAAPSSVRVWGQVTYNGKPLEAGVIVFVPEKLYDDCWGASGIDKNGRYQLTPVYRDKAVVPGRYDIFVKIDRGQIAPANEVLRGRGPELKGGEPVATPALASTPKSLIPERFTSQKTSGLSVVLTKVPMRVDVNLTD